MRTKTLLLTAALSAAGIATSMAQVYSVNAVGYVNTTLVPGFNLVSNPLINTEQNGNQIQNLFNSLPDGTSVYIFQNGRFDIVGKDFGTWEPANFAAQEIRPGSGVFVRNTSGANQTVTFVGEVPQGTLTTPLPAGFSIVSSQVPQEGTPAALGFVAKDGDSLYFFEEASQSYNIVNFDFGEYDKALPTLAVGEAFFVRKAAADAAGWTRTFSVN
jgi:hypothetical protein